MTGKFNLDLINKPPYKPSSFSQTTIDDFVNPQPKPVDWTPEGLHEHIIRFVVETDQVRFNIYSFLHL